MSKESPPPQAEPLSTVHFEAHWDWMAFTNEETGRPCHPVGWCARVNGTTQIPVHPKGPPRQSRMRDLDAMAQHIAEYMKDNFAGHPYEITCDYETKLEVEHVEEKMRKAVKYYLGY